MSVRVAVIGAGRWGKNVVRTFHQLGVLCGICDANPENEIFGRFPSVKRYAGVADVMSDPEIDAVAVTSPAELHYNMAKAALMAGKHVFVEKPLSLSVAEGAELIDIAKLKGLVLMVGHLLQYHPAFIRLKELVSEGRLGKLRYIYSHRVNMGTIRKEENILWSFAPHDISMLLSLAGEMPEQGWASGGNYLHEKTADVTMNSLSFKNGIKSHIFVSWLNPFKEHKLVVVGEKAMAVFDDTLNKDKLLLFPHRVEWKEGNTPVAVKEDAVPVECGTQEPLLEECGHFLQCVEKGSKPRTDGEEGLRVLRVLNALQRSLQQNGFPVRLDDFRERKYFAHETAVIDNEVEIGGGTRIWHFSHIIKGSRIGDNCRIGQNVVVGPRAVVGNNVKIQNNVSVYEGVTLEDNVFCGPSMVFTNVFNPRSEIPRMSELRKTLVRSGATIGANATIICGNTIGRYAFIGAGAIVTKDVPSYALIVGNPAKQSGWVCKCGEKLKRGRGGYVCGCGNLYKLSKGAMEPVSEK